jgi:hypothetical protein
MISDGKARRIASEWHGGQATLAYSFASCGYVEDPEELIAELGDGRMSYADGETDEVVALTVGEMTELHEYIREVGQREAQPGWSGVWE